ncbi:MAG: class F sortase, partial [Egibacteraceae bacterium]
AAPVPAAPPTARAAGVADPTRVVIPGIGVDAEVVPLSLQPDGGLEVPKDFSKAGWYRDGPEPGERGAAVVVGHVDSRRAPAVFFRLRELASGDEVLVQTADGGSVRFVVERVEEHPKRAFPTAAVYGPTPEPTLRLVTCGGTFDRSARGYRGSVVVFARLAASGAGQPSR